MKFIYNLQVHAADDTILEEELSVPAAEIKLAAVTLFVKHAVDCRVWLQIILMTEDGIFYGEDGQPVVDAIMLHGSF